MPVRHTSWKKYFIVLAITVTIFGTAIYLSNYFSQKKINEVKTIQDQVSIDILSSETQFSLLESASCQSIASSTTLSDELSDLGARLDYAEAQDTDNAEVLSLKQNYSLLEIRDFVLQKQIAEKCRTAPVTIVYFYSNKPGDCPDCTKEGYVLNQLRADYPAVRVYSFDYDLPLSAVQTLAKINKITDSDLPALVINDTTYRNFQSLETLETLAQIKALSATSTKVRK